MVLGAAFSTTRSGLFPYDAHGSLDSGILLSIRLCCSRFRLAVGREARGMVVRKAARDVALKEGRLAKSAETAESDRSYGAFP